MPILIDTGRAETRATTNVVMAAVEGFWGWMLFGPRQHEHDLLLSLGPVPRWTTGESRNEGVQR